MLILAFVAIYGIYYRQFLKNRMWPILLFVLFSLITELIGGYYLYFNSQKHVNSYVYNVFTLLEYALISYYLWSQNKNKYIGFVIFAAGFIIYFKIANEILNPQTQIFNFNLLFLSSLVFVSIALLKLFKLLNYEKNILLYPHFWILAGIVFYYAGFFFLSNFINMIYEKNQELAKSIWPVNYILNAIYYSLILKGFVCQLNLAKRS